MIKDLMKNKFITGTLILLTGGFLSKFLGFILKIIITRQIGVEGLGLYSLITPTNYTYNNTYNICSTR